MSSHITLNTGEKMPRVGLGTAFAYEDSIRKAVNQALECGYRSIDTAFFYENESDIGAVLEDWFHKVKIQREDVFVTTKLPPQANRRKDVSRFLEQSLKKLQLSYVDLYLVHHPFGFYCNYLDGSLDRNEDKKINVDFETDLEDVWKTMEEQVEKGKAKAIGVSNFNIRQCERIMKIAKIPPAVNQIELHCYLQQPELVKKCKELGIAVVAYSPLGAPYSDDLNDNHMPLLENSELLNIGKRYGKSIPQVALKYLLQQDIIVIPKSVTPERIKANFDVFDFQLTLQEMQDIEKLDRGEDGRIYNFRSLFIGCEAHPEYPF